MRPAAGGGNRTHGPSAAGSHAGVAEPVAFAFIAGRSGGVLLTARPFRRLGPRPIVLDRPMVAAAAGDGRGDSLWCAMSDFAGSAREVTPRPAGTVERAPLTTLRRARGGPWSTAVMSEARR
jgi:hypothetical protein